MVRTQLPNGRPYKLLLEFLALVGPRGAQLIDFIHDLAAINGGKITGQRVRDLVMEAQEKGYQVETTRTMGITSIFAPPHAMPAIYDVCDRYGAGKCDLR